MEPIHSLMAVRRSRVERLRASDPTFDEICGDYEALLRLLRASESAHIADDIQASLSGLADEIRQYADSVKRPEATPDSRPASTKAAIRS